MRLKKGIKLRKMGDKYMVVNLSDDNANLANVLTLNETAASVWLEFKNREFEVADVAQWLEQHYEVTRQQAADDAARLIQEWVRGAVIK